MDRASVKVCTAHPCHSWALSRAKIFTAVGSQYETGWRLHALCRHPPGPRTRGLGGLIHDRVEYLWGACGRQDARVQPFSRCAAQPSAALVSGGEAPACGCLRSGAGRLEPVRLPAAQDERLLGLAGCR